MAPWHNLARHVSHKRKGQDLKDLTQQAQGPLMYVLSTCYDIVGFDSN